jgi:hypothetical protein
MKFKQILQLLFITCVLKGAAYDEKMLHIFNATKNTALFLRLYEDKQPHTILKTFPNTIEQSTTDIFKLPPESCIKIMHDFERNGRLRLHIRSDSNHSKTQKYFHKKNAFRGQIIKSNYNAFIILNKRALELPLKILAIRGYTFQQKIITSPNQECLIVLKTMCSSIEIFKSDLKHALNSTEDRGHIDLESYSTIGTFKAPDA